MKLNTNYRVGHIISITIAVTLLLVFINVTYGTLLFHSVVELFCVIIGITTAIVAWHTHKHTQNYFLLYLGIGYFWIAFLDFFHMLTFPGMPFVNLSTANITLHFWVYGRALEALILLSAPLFLTRQFNALKVSAVFLVISFLFSYFAINQDSPLFFIEGQGLTSAKVWSEFAIISALFVAMVFYWRAKVSIASNVRLYIVLSLLSTISAEFFFTQYVNVYGMSSQIGHLFKIASFLMIYFAIVQTMLKEPFSFLTLTAQSYNAIPQPAIVIDNTGMIKQANLAAQSTFTIPSRNNVHFHAISHDPSISEVNCEICQKAAAGEALPTKVFENLRNGCSYLISLTPLQFTDHNAGFIQIAFDVTKQVEEQRNLLLAGTIINNLSEGVMITDVNSKIISVNKAFTLITGYAEQEIFNKTPGILSSGRHKKSYYAAMWKQLNSHDYWRGEIWNKKKSGEEYPELLSIKALRNESNDLTGYIAVFTDIATFKGVESKLRYLSYHDALTGLPNRLMFNEHLNMAIKHSKRTQTKFALFFVDLDNFKSINDSLGHAVGDDVLINISKHIKSILRDRDIVARYGADEFLILVEDININDNLSHIAEKLINSLASPIHYHIDIPIFTSVSIGISIYPDDASSTEQLVQYADSAMHNAKDAGKNSFAFHSVDDNRKAQRRLLLETKLRQALEKNEIYVVYQPKVNASTYEITGAEALVRWKSTELGEIYPDEFISLAENIGEIHKIGEFVLHQALAQVKKWRDLTKQNLSVAVNFSSKQFTCNNLNKTIEAALNTHALPAAALEVEITESLLLKKSSDIHMLLDSISALGIKISIDDFGTGYSALSYLKNYPINVVKIDKSFVDNIVVSHRDAILVKTIILMAHGLGMTVVAEGVEDKEQLTYIQNEQGDIIQGYYFSKPLKENDFIALLKSWDADQIKTDNAVDLSLIS
ncbi:EAL domain-containing protein [Colwelliaceae bacterium 6471]